jgi:thiol-disulfide isomerase/thioredoxin
VKRRQRKSNGRTGTILGIVECVYQKSGLTKVEYSDIQILTSSCVEDKVIRRSFATVFVLMLCWVCWTLPDEVSAAAQDPVLESFHFFPARPLAHGFQMLTVDGQPLDLSALRGKVVLLNFWRKDCRYCEAEKNFMRTMINAARRSDIVVLCVDLWDSPAWVKKYSANYGPGFLFATRPDQGQTFLTNEVNGRFMGYYVLNSVNEAVYEVKGFPSTYVIDKAGRVVAGHMGMARWDSPAILQWLSGLVHGEGTADAADLPETSSPQWLDRLMLVKAQGQNQTSATQTRKWGIGAAR